MMYRYMCLRLFTHAPMCLMQPQPGAQHKPLIFFYALFTHAPMRPMQAQPGALHEPLTFLHAPAEHTGLPSACCDLVSMCLVCHELPEVWARLPLTLPLS